MTYTVVTEYGPPQRFATAREAVAFLDAYRGYAVLQDEDGRPIVCANAHRREAVTA